MYVKKRGFKIRWISGEQYMPGPTRTTVLWLSMDLPKVENLSRPLLPTSAQEPHGRVGPRGSAAARAVATRACSSAPVGSDASSSSSSSFPAAHRNCSTFSGGDVARQEGH